MYREIFTPTQSDYTIHLPTDMIGKEIEVIAFKIEEKKIGFAIDKEKTMSQLLDYFKRNHNPIDKFKFDREEANNYRGHAH